MKILITGAKGFVGKNLVATLKTIKDGKNNTTNLPQDLEICEFDIDTDKSLLDEYCNGCDFVVNLAGVNRPQNTEEFMQGNFGFASELLETLKKYNNTCPVLLSSSTQAALDNPYGRSKKAGEDLFFQYGKETGAKVLVYRYPNVFGKWCRPNYNSAVATFCNNIANDLPIQVNDRNHPMTLVYVDDVVEEIINAMCGNETKDGEFCKIPVEHKITLGEIVDLIYSFKESRENKQVPDMTEGSFSKKLYSTYLSYLPKDKFSYPLKMNVDDRGSFTEILRTVNNGQFSVNISKPHITKGQHWHHTKNEKFLVVAGTGVIRFRKIDSDEVIEYFVSGEKLEVVDIPTGYTHNIENLGDTDMVTFMWCNECFNPEKPDTFFLPVADISIEDNRKKVLVLGGAGMAGHVVSTYFKEQGYDVTIFDITAVDGFSCITGSATDTELLRKVVLEKKYCAVINCIGLLNRACDENRGLASYLNGYLPHYLADILKNSKTKLLHISSDCVFSGNNPPYDEAAVPDASDNYGKTKSVGEIDNDKDITFRTSIVGPDRTCEKQGLVNWFMQQSEVKGFTNVMWSGVSTITLARAMKAAIEQNISGIYHLVNNEFISKHDLLVLFNKHLCNSKVKISADDSASLKKIIVNTRKDFNFIVPSYEEMVIEIADWIKNHPEVYSHYTK